MIQALFGYFQYFFLEAGNMFGYNTKANRPYGIFQQPNVMASFLATGFVLSAYLLQDNQLSTTLTERVVSALSDASDHSTTADYHRIPNRLAG